MLRDNLRRHVFAVGSRERNLWQPAPLEAAARHIEDALAGFGYTPSAQRFTTGGVAVRNIEAEITGGARAGEIVIVGAHYDSVQGAACCTKSSHRSAVARSFRPKDSPRRPSFPAWTGRTTGRSGTRAIRR